MFVELRPATGDVATTPEVWAETFRHSVAYSVRTDISCRLDSRWGLIRRHVPKGGRVLDAGCGFGEWVEFLCRRGYRAEGLDYSPELISRLSETYPQRTWTRGATQSMPYPDASFDGIVSWGVIEHDPDGPQRALVEFRRVLKPGGSIIVTVPVDTVRMRTDSKRQFPNGGKFFQYLFTPADLSRELTEAGFRTRAVGACSKNAQTLLFPRARSVNAATRAICKLIPAIPGYHAMIYAICEPVARARTT